MPLLTATFNGRGDRVQQIVSESVCDVDQRDAHSASALHIASVYGHRDCLRILLKNKASSDLIGA